MTEGQTEHPTRLIVVARDLFFTVRIGNALRPRGYQVETASSRVALRALLEPAALSKARLPALIIVDLAFGAIDPPGVIAELKRGQTTAAIPILAFGPHLDQAARAAAQAAGADRVVANSKLVEALPELVARYARVIPADPTGD